MGKAVKEMVPREIREGVGKDVQTLAADYEMLHEMTDLHKKNIDGAYDAYKKRVAELENP